MRLARLRQGFQLSSLQGSYIVIHHPMSQQMRFSNLGGVPALFIIIFNVVLVILGTVKIGRLRG